LKICRLATLKGQVQPAAAGTSALTVMGVVHPAGAEATNDALRFVVHTRTDAQGAFAFEGPQGTLDLRFMIDGYAPTYQFGVAARRATSLVPVTLVRGGSVAGRTRDAVSGIVASTALLALRRNSPVPARTQPEDAGRDLLLSHATKADENGFFQFRGVAPGRYWLVAESGRHAPTELGVEVEVEAESYLDDVWLQPYRTVDIHVSPARDPSGRAWTVALRSLAARLRQDLQGWARAATDVEGIVGFARVTATPHEVEVVTANGEVLYTEVHVLPPEGEPLAITVPLVAVEGRVRRGTSPVAGARVMLSAGEADDLSFVTDERGRFNGWMRRPEEVVHVELVLAAGGGRSLAVTPEFVLDDRIRLDIDVGNVALAVTVVDERDTPVAGARVLAVTNEKTSVAGRGSTDREGTVLLEPLTSGRYVVNAISPDKGTSDRVAVELPAEGSVNLTLVLRATHDVPLHLESPAGVPVAGADISILTQVGRDRQRTDTSGRAVVKVAREVRGAVVRVFDRSHMLWTACVALPPEGETLRLRLPPGGAGALRLELTGSLLPGSSLWLVNGHGGALNLNDLASWQRTVTGDRGSERVLDLPGIAAGHYWLVWWPSFDESGLVATLCSGAVPAEGPGGEVGPQSPVTIRADMRK
jgi:hypothetical protein